MLLWLFRWPIIIEWCWLGVLKPSLRKNLGTNGVVSSKSTKKIQYEENLCYLAFKKTIGPQKGKLLLDIIPGRQVAKPIFNRGGQGCGIISYYG